MNEKWIENESVEPSGGASGWSESSINLIRIQTRATLKHVREICKRRWSQDFEVPLNYPILLVTYERKHHPFKSTENRLNQPAIHQWIIGGQ